MLEFAHPGWFFALPLPLLVYFLVPAYRVKQAAVQVPFFTTLVELSGQQASEGAVRLSSQVWQKLALGLCWGLIVIALAKPLMLGEVQQREMFGRDVMVLVDLSGSMAANDFVDAQGEQFTRLAAVKRVLKDFSQARQGDRLGLILFGDAAYLQSPFTADHEAWLELVNETEVGMAGQSTHLGDALGLAIKFFSDSALEQKVAIVLTDGNDTDSLVPPLDAAKVAAARGIKVHMIAMGDPSTVGEEALDMQVIEQVAKLTGGRAFQALSPGELQAVYQSIAELEPAQYLSVNYQPKTSVHHVPMIAALLLYVLLFSVVTVRRLWRARHA